MTLVQASIANNGNSVVLIADRLLTTHLSVDLPPYEFESHTPKIVIQENIGIGFAGSGLYADVAMAKIEEKTDLDDIVDTISKYISETRQDIVNKNIKRTTGVSSTDFFTRPEYPIPPEIRGMIYSELRDFSINCQCIVTGFDKKNKSRIVVIDEEGDKVEGANFGVVSIGSGSPFSRVYFDQYGYDTQMSTKESILFAFEAKKWAQAHTGVGENTDILVFTKDKKEIKIKKIYDDSDLMKKLKEVYSKEIEKKKELREKLLEELFKDDEEI